MHEVIAVFDTAAAFGHVAELESARGGFQRRPALHRYRLQMTSVPTTRFIFSRTTGLSGAM
jgi:hypothetical protein